MATKTNLNQASWQVIMDPYFAAQLRNNKQFNRFGMAKMYSSKGTSGVIKFKKYPRIAAATTALTEGTAPSEATYTATNVSMTPLEYGNYVSLTNLAVDDSTNDEIKELIDNLADNASRTLNIITRDVLLTTTNIYYANDVASVGAVVTGISEDDLLAIMAEMEADNVMYVTDYVGGSTKDNTTPIEPAFIGITHSHASKDIRKLTNFLPPAQYGTGDKLIGEIGSVYNVRFVADSECKITADAGGAVGSTGLRSTSGSNIDVYDTMIIGKDAYIRVKLNKDTVQTYVKEFGSAGTADPLNQKMTVGWRVRHGACILYTEKVLRYRHGVLA